MLKIGRYFWVQTKAPTIVRHFLWFWVLKEARPLDVDRQRRWDLGTRLQNEEGCWRYAWTSVKLRRGTIVEPPLAAKVLADGDYTNEPTLAELVYGDVRPVLDANRVPQTALGWPDVDVPERRYFWIHEVPPGAEFEKEN